MLGLELIFNDGRAASAEEIKSVLDSFGVNIRSVEFTSNKVGIVGFNTRKEVFLIISTISLIVCITV